MKRLLLYSFLFCAWCYPSLGQYNIHLHQSQRNGNNEYVNAIKDLKLKSDFKNKFEQSKYISRLIIECVGLGYLEANIDSIWNTDSLNTHVELFIGNKYKWVQLLKGNADPDIISESGLKEKNFADRPISPHAISSSFDRALRYAENNGYPFAELFLDSIEIENYGVSAAINYSPGTRITIDSIVINGDAKISDNYILNYIGVRKGTIYNESKISQISRHLSDLQFVEETRPAQVFFEADRAAVFVYLKSRSASQFDGIIGLLTDQVTSKVKLTGDVRLNLQNAFAVGEHIDVNWKSSGSNTQDLKARFLYPYFLSTPLGADMAFNLYKKDTTYLDLITNFGFRYLLQGGNYYKAFVKTSSSTLLSTSGLQNINTLPEYADIKTTLYGIGAKATKLDYRLNPRKGFVVEASTSVGNKKISKNSALNDALYTGVVLRSVQWRGDIEASYYFPLSVRSVFASNFYGGYVTGKELFSNEMFRLGGLRSLRGFDEESILASVFEILNVEYRYILEKNSYLFVFANGAYYERRGKTNFVHDTPVGMGAGIAFDSKLGIFNLSYGVGKQFDNPIDFKAAKIHFGIVNLF